MRPPHAPATPDLAGLAAAARRGERRAFDELVRLTYRDVFGLALRLTGDEHDASDVAQEAYLRAYRSIRRFRGEAAFSTWMYRITANCAATLRSRPERAPHQVLDTVAPDATTGPAAGAEHDPEARSERSAERDRLGAALATLSPGLRAVVVLRDVYDLPHKVIAEELGISDGAAKVRLHQARRQLRTHLDATAAGAGERGMPRAV